MAPGGRAEDVFDQIDELDQGIHGSGLVSRRQHRQDPQYGAYGQGQPQYGAPQYDVRPGYPTHDGYPHGYPQYAEETQRDYYDDSPRLDAFDRQLLKEPDYNSRHGQAEMGNARLTLPASQRQQPWYHGVTQAPEVYQQPQPAPSQRLYLSQYAFGSDRAGLSSSPTRAQYLASGPAFGASQRRPPVDVDRVEETPRQAIYQKRQQHLRAPNSSSDELPRRDTLGNHHLTEKSLFRSSNQQHAAVPRSVLTAASGTPVVQGISLVSTHELPDRFRSIFPFPLFNAVQSKSFETIYKTNDNFVLSSPTGSGKTAILELAICRLINGFSNGSFKIVYQAPTKSLCAERQRDWQAKFGPLDIQCAELTGDTEASQLSRVQAASIIITTPEKWDSMTRKWKDHGTLMQMVRLFLIDEVHILKEDRGATLEAVVSRMKSIGSEVRFVALSATVPNSQDIAAWLGKDPMNSQLPAIRERFGEEFRPVRLQKHVCGYNHNSNDFSFEKFLNSKLPEVIAKWSQRKPLMVFCFTRASCVGTAKVLSNWWATKGPRDRYWGAPRNAVRVVDKDLRDTTSSGVAFHHAGLSMEDRNAVEKGYLCGDVNVICCTSTLAVGVNLPCHMVIMKNTVTYAGPGSQVCKEYSDLEVMQMLGRAGRPQFDDSAVAVIMTRLEKVKRYEKMMTGQEVLESCLHRNLIDHLNAEIGLGTITNASSAKKWLAGTFLYVRLKEHPEHYRIEGDAPGRNLDERLDNICTRAIDLLSQHHLVDSADTKLKCTEFGDAMARYYIQFETMKIFLSLPPKAKISEILSAIAQAAEFKDVRFRAGEKSVYKELNKDVSIKFPIPVNLDLPAQKVSLVIQSILGAVDLPTQDIKHRNEHLVAKGTVFQHCHRLIRCIIDCQIQLQDAVASRNALMLSRSLGAQVWDDSPLHMKQLEGIGPVLCRKLAFAGIRSIEEIENAEASTIERSCSRQPPFGGQLLQKARDFPKLRVVVKMAGDPIAKKGQHVSVRLKAEIGFLNDKVPDIFNRKPVHVVMLAETSDGQLVHFARISAKKLKSGQDVLFTADLTAASQSIGVYVMCDGFAGTLREAVLKPKIMPTLFPTAKPAAEMNRPRVATSHAPNTSKRRVSAVTRDDASDEFGDAGLDDDDLAAMAGDDDGFMNIDEIDATNMTEARLTKKRKADVATKADAPSDWEPIQLENGNWACGHLCKDKPNNCKHDCCRDGSKKKPRPPKPRVTEKDDGPHPELVQTHLKMPASKPFTTDTDVLTYPGTHGSATAAAQKRPEPPQMERLNRLHDNTQRPGVTAASIGKLKPISKSICKSNPHGQPKLSFLQAARAAENESDYGDFSSTDLPDIDALISQQAASQQPSLPRKSVYDIEEAEDNEMLDREPSPSPNDEVPLEARHSDLSDYADHHWSDTGFAMPNKPIELQRDVPSMEQSDQRAIANMPFVTSSSDPVPPNKDPGAEIVPATHAVSDAAAMNAFDQAFLAEGDPVADAESSQQPSEEKKKWTRKDESATTGDVLKEWFFGEFSPDLFEWVESAEE